MSTRPSWDAYFVKITQEVSTRSTCERRLVGAVIVKDRRILATGYNGAPAGFPHCDETGCLRQTLGIPSGERQEICRGLHAEQNAIIQAALHGIQVSGADLYTTHEPCITCAKMIINAGIRRVVAVNSYPDDLARSFIQQSGIEFVLWRPSEAQ